jgi:telomere length regulation protein
MERFQEMRLQGMIAVLIAQPLRMGQWFSNTFFEGDYSVAQRASIITTLGMGARGWQGLKSKTQDSLERTFCLKIIFLLRCCQRSFTKHPR